MTDTRKQKASTQKVGAHRARLRAQGLRPIQIWVPDVDAASFKAEAHRQSLLVAAADMAADDQAYIDVITDWSAE